MCAPKTSCNALASLESPAGVEVEPEKIVPEANLKETLGLDSLDYIDLVVVIESNFAFKVKPEDFTNIATFQDFCDYVISRVNSKELV